MMNGFSKWTLIIADAFCLMNLWYVFDLSDWFICILRYLYSSTSGIFNYFLWILFFLSSWVYVVCLKLISLIFISFCMDHCFIIIACLACDKLVHIQIMSSVYAFVSILLAWNIIIRSLINILNSIGNSIDLWIRHLCVRIVSLQMDKVKLSAYFYQFYNISWCSYCDKFVD